MRNEGYGEYWVCIIGPTVLPQQRIGQDAVLRSAVVAAFESVYGGNYTCWSGWGNSEADARRINDAWHSGEEITDA